MQACIDATHLDATLATVEPAGMMKLFCLQSGYRNITTQEVQMLRAIALMLVFANIPAQAANREGPVNESATRPTRLRMAL